MPVISQLLSFLRTWKPLRSPHGAQLFIAERHVAGWLESSLGAMFAFKKFTNVIINILIFLVGRSKKIARNKNYKPT